MWFLRRAIEQAFSIYIVLNANVGIDTYQCWQKVRDNILLKIKYDTKGREDEVHLYQDISIVNYFFTDRSNIPILPFLFFCEIKADYQKWFIQIYHPLK